MPTLTIRNLDPAVKTRLRVQAAQNGRSMEEEVRTIIGRALDTPAEAPPRPAPAPTWRETSARSSPHFAGSCPNSNPCRANRCARRLTSAPGRPRYLRHLGTDAPTIRIVSNVRTDHLIALHDSCGNDEAKPTMHLGRADDVAIGISRAIRVAGQRGLIRSVPASVITPLRTEPIPEDRRVSASYFSL
jgi:plasmid stability protein